MDTLRRGETLSHLLARGGIDDSVRALVLGAAPELDPRSLRAGMAISMRARGEDSLPHEIVLHLDDERRLLVRRTGDGWTAEEERIPWRSDTIVVEGEIRSSLYAALDEAKGAAAMPRAVRSELAWKLADIFEYRVDMSRDLQAGDRFRALVTRAVSPGGDVRAGEVLAARFTLSGTELEAIRWDASSRRAEYFDREGKSLRLAFLRAPLAFRRISSVFGKRWHPVLGSWRQHKGTDYAASSGTPIRAIGDGTVIFAGWRGGYGRTVEVRHRNGYVTRYGHMRGFARGVRAGARVAIGETIGYVGMTGLATGPHLHFEVLVGGVQRDPRKALASRSGDPIGARERPAFESKRAELVAMMDGAGGGS
jgi:murein DD-endopeptidase MepM/ murein hydrolase activator NlpD